MLTSYPLTIKKVSLVLLVLALLLIGSYLAWSKFFKQPEPVYCTQEAKLCPDGSYVGRTGPTCEFTACPKVPVEKSLKLFYYNPEKDKDEQGNIKCSQAGLVSINRNLPLSQTTIQNAIELLLKGKQNLTPAEMDEGVTTEFPLEGFSLVETNLMNNGTLILKFSDPLFKTSGGACRVGILWHQIEATAKQFSGVAQVKFLPEELFQP